MTEAIAFVVKKRFNIFSSLCQVIYFACFSFSLTIYDLICKLKKKIVSVSVIQDIGNIYKKALNVEGICYIYELFLPKKYLTNALNAHNSVYILEEDI